MNKFNVLDNGLIVNKISKSYGNKPIVRDLSLNIKKGEIVGLLGPNGAGKTTCFYIACGLVRSNKGEVFLNNKSIGHMPMHKRANLGLGYLPQEPSIFRKLSVEDNIMAVLELNKSLSAKHRKHRLEELLSEFNVEHVRHIKGMTLSGGERRRVEIARALAMDPKFILLDEPFAGIDPISVIDIKDIITHLSKRNIGVLITDHNVRETLSITDRAYLLYEGSILKSGSARELSEDEEARRLYLGRKFKMDFTD